MTRKHFTVFSVSVILLTAVIVLSALMTVKVQAASSQTAYVYDSLYGIRIGANQETSMPEGLYVAVSRISAGELYDRAVAASDGRDFILYDVYILNADGTVFANDKNIVFSLALPIPKESEPDYFRLYRLDELNGNVTELETGSEDGFIVTDSNNGGLFIIVNTDDGGKTLILGDIDFDGKVTAYDARLALRLAVGYDDNLSAAAKKNADVDEDGKATAFDARYILRYAVGLM